MGGCVQVICTYYAILYKGLECLWILVSARGPGTNPHWIPRYNYVCMYVCVCVFSIWMTYR